MREIKFRAWDRKEKEMIEEAIVFGNIGAGDGSVLVNEKAQRGNELDWTQYTGYKDEKDIEAYEGDVIEFEEPVFESQVLMCPIVFHEGGFCAEWQRSDSVHWFPLSQIGHWFEVKGNIYQNPELLK